MKKVYFGLVRIVLVSLLLAAFAFPQETGAIMGWKSFATMAREASFIVIGEVTGLQSWSKEKGRIFTNVSIQVERDLKGRLKKGETVNLTLRGGTDGGLTLRVEHEPVFKEREKAAFFLRSNKTIVGLERGKYTINNRDQLLIPGAKEGIPVELGIQLIKVALRDKKSVDELEMKIRAKMATLVKRRVSDYEIRNIIEKDIGMFLEKYDIKRRY